MDDQRTAADRLAADRRCLFGTADHPCGDPALLHVLQRNETPTMSCERHVGYWQRVPYLDAHPISGSCGMPGTTWQSSLFPGDFGFCFVDSDEQVDEPVVTLHPDDPRPGLFFVVAGMLVGTVVGAVTATAILGLTIWTGLGGVLFAWVCGAAGGWLANRRERR